jgi:hypothetical protein
MPGRMVVSTGSPHDPFLQNIASFEEWILLIIHNNFLARILISASVPNILAVLNTTEAEDLNTATSNQ